MGDSSIVWFSGRYGAAHVRTNESPSPAASPLLPPPSTPSSATLPATSRIDGSGMLEAAPDAQPLTAVGDTFDIDMDRTPLNDIPGLVKYSVRNTVTQIEPGRLVEWTIGAPSTSRRSATCTAGSSMPVDDEHDRRHELLRLDQHRRRAARRRPHVADRARGDARGAVAKLDRLVTGG